MNTFKTEINIEEDKEITIKVWCEKRSSSDVKKEVYREDVVNLIPEKYKKTIVLTSGPAKKVSNIDSIDFVNEGVWVFSIARKKEPVKTRTKTKSLRSNTSIKSKIPVKKLDNL